MQFIQFPEIDVNFLSGIRAIESFEKCVCVSVGH